MTGLGQLQQPTLVREEQDAIGIHQTAPSHSAGIFRRTVVTCFPLVCFARYESKAAKVVRSTKMSEDLERGTAATNRLKTGSTRASFTRNTCRHKEHERMATKENTKGR